MQDYFLAGWIAGSILLICSLIVAGIGIDDNDEACVKGGRIGIIVAILTILLGPILLGISLVVTLGYIVYKVFTWK